MGKPGLLGPPARQAQGCYSGRMSCRHGTHMYNLLPGGPCGIDQSGRSMDFSARKCANFDAVRADRDTRHRERFPGTQRVPMDKAILLAVVARLCTAADSVAQRQGARSIR
jgi:hypothetical protein